MDIKKKEESQREHFLWLAKNTKNLLKAMHLKKSPWCDDEQFVVECLKAEPHALRYASERLRGKKSIVYPVIKRSSDLYVYASEDLKVQKDFVLLMAKCDKYSSFFSSKIEKKWVHDKEVMMHLIDKDGIYFDYLPKDLRTDEDFLLKLIRKCPNTFANFDRSTRSNKSFVIKALKAGADYIDIAWSLKKDEEVLFEALKKNTNFFSNASEKLRSDRLVALMALEFDGNLYRYLSDDLRGEKDLLLLAIKSCAVKNEQINFSDKIPEKLKTKDVALLCASRDSGLLRSFYKFVDDKDVVMEALKSNGEMLSFVSDECQMDPKIALIAAKSGGKSWACGSEKYKTNIFYCYKALQNYAWIYVHLSEKQKDEPFLAHLVIKEDGSLIRHSSERIRDDLIMVYMALNYGLENFECIIGPKVKKCVEFAMLDLERGPNAFSTSIKEDSLKWFVKNLKTKEYQDFLKSIDYEDLGSTLNYRKTKASVEPFKMGM